MIVNTSAAVTAQIIRTVEDRKIVCAFHDVDGTHSLIRNWPPVMSRILYDTAVHGMVKQPPEEENVARLAALCGTKPLEETDRICVESAGISSLTLMEWALRRNVELTHGKFHSETNSRILQRIRDGEENFDDEQEPEEYRAWLAQQAPILFRVYTQVLNRYCRDRNMTPAKVEAEHFLIPGSMDFIRYLHGCGVKNYFISDAAQSAEVREELSALGFRIGAGEDVEDVFGFAPEEKLSRDGVIRRLITQTGVSGENVLVVGDGRSEISAGIRLGAVTMSVLPEIADRQRELHVQLGTNIMVSDYLGDDLKKIFR